MATNLLAAQGEEGGGFHAPTLSEFFPGQLFGEGTWWGPTRINLIGLLMGAVVVLFFFAAFRKPSAVPGRMQNLGELAVDFVRREIIDEVIGESGRRFLPFLAAMFFMILALNLAGIIPLLNIAGTAVVSVPLMLALVSWIVFNAVGVKKHGLGGYLKANLFPPGVPKPLYILLTPIEAVSTFLIRPFTLTVRLLANMMAGHFMLVLFFSGASYLLFESTGFLKVFGVGSVLMGFIFTLFEILVAALQAYIFTLLTSLYIAGALSEEH